MYYFAPCKIFLLQYIHNLTYAYTLAQINLLLSAKFLKFHFCWKLYKCLVMPPKIDITEILSECLCLLLLLCYFTQDILWMDLTPVTLYQYRTLPVQLTLDPVTSPAHSTIQRTVLVMAVMSFSPAIMKLLLQKPLKEILR